MNNGFKISIEIGRKNCLHIHKYFQCGVVNICANGFTANYTPRYVSCPYNDVEVDRKYIL